MREEKEWQYLQTSILLFKYSSGKHRLPCVTQLCTFRQAFSELSARSFIRRAQTHKSWRRAGWKTWVDFICSQKKKTSLIWTKNVWQRKTQTRNFSSRISVLHHYQNYSSEKKWALQTKDVFKTKDVFFYLAFTTPIESVSCLFRRSCKKNSCLTS